jgi:glycosyltransferase involved in cell wall biosynthesis
MSISILNELKPLPFLDFSRMSEPSLDVSLIIPAKNSGLTLEKTVREAHQFLTRNWGKSFEIILVPNGNKEDSEDPSIPIAKGLAEQFPEVQVQPHFNPPGKGAAVRTGFSVSRGKYILFTDADLPYDLDFFLEAISMLQSGFDLITGNRRLPESHFDIPVELLPIAYQRHRLGLGFNRFVRLLLPVQTTDTQAGIKAMSRRLATAAFSKQSCPGFLFDLELFLTAHGLGYWQSELPVILYLNSEKSTVRILRECVLVANWLTRLSWRNLRMGYGTQETNKGDILSRYRDAPFLTRLFLDLRWRLTPYSRMVSYLPSQGPILDLGCGHGLFALAVGMKSPSREVIGIDHDDSRIELASHAIQDLPNIRLEKGSMVELPRVERPFAGIAIIDAMHYFDFNTQESILKQTYSLLEKGGRLLVREVDPEGGMASSWNRFYERIATAIGFTQAKEKNLHFRSRKGWQELMESIGFKVTSERCSSFLFADILYICERP